MLILLVTPAPAHTTASHCRPDRSWWWRHHGQWSPHCTSGHGAHLETTVSSFVVINIPPVLGSVSTPQLHGDQCQCGHPAPLIATTRQCNTAGLGAERDQSCHPPKSNCWPGRDTGEEHNTSHKTHYIANSALPAATQLLLAPSPISILLMRITEILLIHGRLQSGSKRQQQDTNSSSLRIIYFTLFSIDCHLVMKNLNAFMVLFSPYLYLLQIMLQQIGEMGQHFA